MENEEKPLKRGRYFYWIIPLALFIIFVTMVYDTSAFQNCAFMIKSWVTFNHSGGKSLEGVEKLEIKSKNDIIVI